MLKLFVLISFCRSHFFPSKLWHSPGGGRLNQPVSDKSTVLGQKIVSFLKLHILPRFGIKSYHKKSFKKIIRSFYIRCTVTWQMTAKDGLLSPDSQIVITNVGCGIPRMSGIAEELPLELQLVRRWMLTWSHPHFGWSAVESLRSRAVMTPVTLLC